MEIRILETKESQPFFPFKIFKIIFKIIFSMHIYIIHDLILHNNHIILNKGKPSSENIDITAALILSLFHSPLLMFQFAMFRLLAEFFVPAVSLQVSYRPSCPVL